MPKHKVRKSGEVLRIFKGKCAFEVSLEIQDDFEDETDDAEYDDRDNDITNRSIKPLVEPVEPIDNRKYDEILLEAFGKANEKSSQIRLNAFITMCNQLQRHYIPKFLNKHMTTIRNILESIFERNMGPEVKWAGRLVALCYIQLPYEIKFLDKFRKILIAAFDNPNLTTIRNDLCNVIAVLIFLNKNTSKIVFNTMTQFEEIFFKTFYTGVRIREYDVGGKPNSTSDELELVVTALEAWTFLHTLVICDTKPSQYMHHSSDIFMQNLMSLFKHSSYKLRIACAKTIAVLHGSGETEEKRYVESNLSKIITEISMIQKTHVPYGYDDKTKMTVLFYLKVGTIPRREIRIGRKILELNTWSYNIQYDMLCNIFGSANVPRLLQENKFLLNLLNQFNSFESSSNQKSSSSTSAEVIPNHSLSSSRNT